MQEGVREYKKGSGSVRTGLGIQEADGVIRTRRCHAVIRRRRGNT